MKGKKNEEKDLHNCCLLKMCFKIKLAKNNNDCVIKNAKPHQILTKI